MKTSNGRIECGARAAERGMSVVMAVFALVLLTSMGILLLYVSQTDVRIGQTDLESKRSFYGAEAALEQGREGLRQWNIASGTIELDDELALATGANGVIDFDPSAVQPIYDSDGQVTGFTGTGDDNPVRPLAVTENGAVVAYLTNDPADGRSNLSDSNKQLNVTGMAVTADGSFEVVEAVVDSFNAVPRPAAAITLLGDDPVFMGGSSSAKYLTGDDCRGAGIPGLSVPVVGVLGPDNEADAELGVTKPETFVEGSETGIDTIDDIDSSIDARWKECEYLIEFARRFMSMADVVGNSSTPLSALGTPGDPKLVFINDDYEVLGNFTGAGALWVTGDLRFDGRATWFGPIFVIGTGFVDRFGAGNGEITGGVIVANVSGPDEIIFTSDDCSGPDGTPGTGDDGLGLSPTWDVSGSGTGDTVYCTDHLDIFSIRWPFDVIEFRQR